MTQINDIFIAIEQIANDKIKDKILHSIKPLLDELSAFASHKIEKNALKQNWDSSLNMVFAISQNNEEVFSVTTALVDLLVAMDHPYKETATKTLENITNTNSKKSPKTTIIKPLPISGFLEFTPEIQLHLDNILDQLKKLFTSHGFAPIDTPVVERLEILAAKGGDVDKEIYTLGRAKADNQDNSDTEAELGLRYDLTVPFARYIAAHFQDINFPFKRYHIGPCWRGERPQDGRYRQFTQADIDIVNPEQVPLSFDADIPLIVNEAISLLGIQDYVFRISNRKILQGYLSGLQVQNIQMATRILDKIDKIGAEAVLKLLVDEVSLDSQTAEQVIKIANICTEDDSFAEQVRSLNIQHPILDKGIEELQYVMHRVNASNQGQFRADLSITRGFDYYTGSVYEVRWNQHPQIGSIAAGGRYDDLASHYIRKKLPGVGMSVGISRIYGKLVQTNAIQIQRKTPTDILIAWEPEAEEADLHQLAAKLRSNNMNTEVYFGSEKITKQVSYANKKGIPYVIFPLCNEYKNMHTGEQKPFDIETFNIVS